MERKIKGSKHHGVKDPEKQRQVREDKIRMKINNRPQKEDFQEVPKSMQIMTSWKENAEFQKKKKPKGNSNLLDSTKHMKKEPWMPGMSKPLRPVPVFKQEEGEHKRAFYYRMHRTIDSMKQQRSYENKFKVELRRDMDGNTKMVEAEKDEVDQVLEDKKNKRLAKKGIVVKTKEEKRQKRREREKIRKLKKKGGKLSEDLDFDSFKDSVKFGEIVHEPPTIDFKSKKLDERKPGKSDLLLKQKMSGGVQKKKKKDKPSMAKKVIMEKERLRAVEAYRALKAERMSKS